MSNKYDKALLDTAPQATKAQLQGGYNPDLLVEKASSSKPATPPVDPEIATHVPTPRQESASLTKRKVPFYATKKGMIIIGVVAFVVVVIAAVVGGVVGSRNKKSLNTSVASAASASATGASSQDSSGVGQGFGSNSNVGSSSRTTSPSTTITQGIQTANT